MKNQADTIAARYSKLSTKREPFLTAARENSKLTIPSLIPPHSDKGSKQKLTKKNPAIGARGTSNLASKLLLTLVPSTALFRNSVNTSDLEKEGQEEFIAEIESQLAKLERRVMDEVDIHGDRVVIGEVLKHLIVGGNELLHIQEKGARAIPLSRYVVVRDQLGNVIEMITEDAANILTFPKDLREALKGKEEYKKAEKEETDVTVFTRITRTENGWSWIQEVFDEKISATMGNCPEGACPWIPLRFNRIDGEDYGRGYIEEYQDDLNSIKILNKAITDGSAAAAKVLILVDPNGSTKAKTIAQAPNGAVREGNDRDVTVLQMDKRADFSTALALVDKIEARLASAFLLNSSIQRPGERVTAEEIRYMASELDDALGGMYAILSHEFQLPYVNRRIAILKKKGQYPHLPKELVRPTVVTGLAALGRGHDLQNILQFIGQIGQLGGPETVSRYVDMSNLIKRIATSMSIETDGLIKSQDQIKQEAQETAEQQMMNQGLPNAINAGGQIASTAIQNQNGETQ